MAKVKSALAGKIQPILSSLILSQSDIQAIIKNVSEMLYIVDLAFLFALGWLLVPAMGIVHMFLEREKVKIRQKLPKIGRKKKMDSSDSSDALNEKVVEGVEMVSSGKKYGKMESSGSSKQSSWQSSWEGDSYLNSYTYLIASHVSQMARLALLVYACDCVVVAFQTIGYKADQWSLVSKIFAKVVYTSWIARRIQSFKNYFLRKLLHRSPEECDKIKLINRLLDFMVLSILLIKILDYLSVETGMAMTSLFAVGTTGGLVISLASQEIAKGVANGVEMAAGDRFYEGDDVHFQDGTQGIIKKMGFLRTKIQNYDGAIVDIPNTQLGGQRITNISRTHICQIIVTLRFEYSDIQKLPGALSTIKNEIMESCPKLILEGRPFRAHVTSFERYYVEAVVNCSFNNPPTGDAYWELREEMLLAIDRGVTKSGLKYAKPRPHLVESGK